MALIAGSSACGGGNGAADTVTALPATATRTAGPHTPTPAAAAQPSPSAVEPSATAPAAASPTAAAQPTAPAASPTSMPSPQTQVLTIVARDTTFSPRTLGASAGVPLTVTLDNQDADVTHDIVLYAPGGGEAARTELIAGPSQRSVTFTPAAAGNYAFKCSVHPQDMTGVLVVT